MNDNEFDEKMRQALALESGPADERAWLALERKRTRFVPSYQEMTRAWSLCCLALLAIWIACPRAPRSTASPNLVAQALLSANRPVNVAEVTARYGY